MLDLRAHSVPRTLPSPSCVPLACRALRAAHARAWAASRSCVLSMPRAKAACRGVRAASAS
eukprot:10017946-Alexandrium_andersonii.AAC.1